MAAWHSKKGRGTLRRLPAPAPETLEAQYRKLFGGVPKGSTVAAEVKRTQQAMKELERRGNLTPASREWHIRRIDYLRNFVKEKK